MLPASSFTREDTIADHDLDRFTDSLLQLSRSLFYPQVARSKTKSAWKGVKGRVQVLGSLGADLQAKRAAAAAAVGARSGSQVSQNTSSNRKFALIACEMNCCISWFRVQLARLLDIASCEMNFSADQVIEMVQQFGVDSATRVDIVRELFPACVEQDELQRWVR